MKERPSHKAFGILQDGRGVVGAGFGGTEPGTWLSQMPSWEQECGSGCNQTGREYRKYLCVLPEGPARRPPAPAVNFSAQGYLAY